MRWKRIDWATPVASFNDVHTDRIESQVLGKLVVWVRVHVPELWLERQAALLVLQGMRLDQLLIPNHFVEVEGYSQRHQLAHLLLGRGEWEPWRARPRLTNLVFANIGKVPPGIPSSALLAALVEDSALA